MRSCLKSPVLGQSHEYVNPSMGKRYAFSVNVDKNINRKNSLTKPLILGVRDLTLGVRDFC